ncbi:MAG TPA: ParB/RepB/Spo0J family partition protein [Clostridiales bacterium]|jgi:ParB family chromosome partitioning protein|nr:ParB/RepB/Spo0J family partition protein [Clostridiales bacterium]
MAKVKPGGLGRGLGALFDDIDFHPEAVSVRKPEEPAGTAPSDTVGRIVHIRLDDIKPNAHQPRTQFDEQSLQELAESISEHGVIQPVLVRPAKNGYELVAGERRYRAARRAGLAEIPAIVRELDDRSNMLFALIENMQREDLNGMEEARGLQEMQEAYGLTQEQVAKTVGKSRPYVANALRLLKLPPAVQAMVEDGSLSAGHARTIAGFDGERRQIEVAEQAVRYGWSVREIEKLARQKIGKKRKVKPRQRDEHARRMEEELSVSLGTRVRIAGTQDKGKIELDYYSRDELDRLLDVLTGLS